MERKAWTVQEVARYLNVHVQTIYTLLSKGELPGFKVRGTWRFWKEDIDEWTKKKSIENE